MSKQSCLLSRQLTHQFVTTTFPKDCKVDALSLLLGTRYLEYPMQLPHPKGRTYNLLVLARHQTNSEMAENSAVKVGPSKQWRSDPYLQSQLTKWTAHEISCFADWHFRKIEMSIQFFDELNCSAWTLAAIRIAHWQMQIWYIWNIGHWKKSGISNSSAQYKCINADSGSIRINCSRKWVCMSPPVQPVLATKFPGFWDEKKSTFTSMCAFKAALKKTCPKSIHNHFRPMNPLVCIAKICISLTPGWYPRVSQSTLPTKHRDDSNVGFTMLHLVWHGFTIHSELKSSSEVLSQKCLKCGRSQTRRLNSYLFHGDVPLRNILY